MSSDRPTPPSIPPRKASAGARPSAAGPRVVNPAPPEPASSPEPRSVPAEPPRAASVPAAAPEAPVVAESTTAPPAAPPVLARLAPPTRPEVTTTAPVEVAAVPVPSAVTAAVSKAVKRASTAVLGAKAAIGAEFTRMTQPPPDGDGSPSPSLKADPSIAATDTHGGATPPGAAAASTPKATPRTTAGGALPPPAARDGAPRRVRLAVSRIDPWSVMKLSFLLSVAIGIMIVVASAVVWFVLDGLAVFTEANNMITEIAGAESSLNILQYVEFSRVVSGATVVAVVDVVLLTALSTIGAFLYNITAALVGGVNLTLTDD